MSKAKDLSNVPTNPTGFRNKIINGAFDVWQRGTSFSAAGFTADRWLIQTDGSGATRAITQQTFTPGNAIAGYESIYHLRYNQSVAGTGATFNILDQRIEDVRTLAGQTITVSFWAKAAANTTIDSSIQQSFGSGGSSEVSGLSSGTFTVTTSWQRFTYTGTLASISGKTVGANSYAAFRINLPRNATFTFDIWGVQVERGTIATPFEQRPIGTELQLCQRYYERASSTSGSQEMFTSGGWDASSTFSGTWNYVTPKRVVPTVFATTGFNCLYHGVAWLGVLSVGSYTERSLHGVRINFNVNGSGVQGQAGIVVFASASAYAEASAEL